MILCFDIDRTLVTSPAVPFDYTTVEPIGHYIRLVNKLYDNGHTIILHTARGMNKEHWGPEIPERVKQITVDTLKAFGVSYHELHFGKPCADVYIDDKALNALGGQEEQNLRISILDGILWS